MKDRDYNDPPTVEELIKKLETLPQDARCYVRPKYHGSMSPVDEVPIFLTGVCRMEPEGKPAQVTFLL